MGGGGVIEFSCAGEPRGKGRPRATVRGSHARVFTDERTRSFERDVRLVAGAAMAGRPPLEGPVEVALRFRMAVPKSFSKRRREAALSGADPYLGAFDLDNLCKAFLDGMNGVVFVDDGQVIRLFLEKKGARQPGVDARIQALDPGEALL